ncbi:MAG: phage tail protein [Oscillospiraceae bacterium]|jgi:phage tail-like protein|nr:phage tail protein [Oscillospiraceae bacterium]
MADVKRFCIRGKGFLQGFLANMQLCENRLVLRDARVGGYVSKVLDSGEPQTSWGRLVVDGQFYDGCEYTIYSFATEDNRISYDGKEMDWGFFLNSTQFTFAEKINVLEAAGAQVNVRFDDVLIADQIGRYFVFAIQIFSEQEVVIRGVDVSFPKETLMQYLPEVFSSKASDFFERYMAIFGSILFDRRLLLAKLPDYVDIDKAPDDVLPILADWLGIGFSMEVWGPDKFRKILKMAKEMSKFRGTKQALEEGLGVFLGEIPIVMEQFKWRKYSGVETQKGCENIYGTHANEFAILITNTVDEITFLHLKRLVDALIPLKAKANIIFLDKNSLLDKYTYLDVNAELIDSRKVPFFDGEYKLDSEVVLV